MGILHSKSALLARNLPGPRFSWRSPRVRAILWQLFAVASVCTILAVVAFQTAENLKERGIASGFGYLSRTTGFEISPGLLPYSSRDSYSRALEVGLINTLRVSLLGIVIATALGMLIGIGRLSKIWVISTIARIYVEVLRNTPLLLQLLFWYSLSQVLPSPRNALNPFPGTFLCVRGVFLPRLVWTGGYVWLVVLPLLTIIVPFTFKILWERTSHRVLTTPILAGATVLLLLVSIAMSKRFVVVEKPVLTGFNFHGGLAISPEFSALLIGLSTYTAAFIGEIVRGGILAVDHGQTEAAAVLGLSRFNVLRLVVLPQALRVIIPPATSQFLNLTKNSSLAVAIGYPDLISVSNTTLNQTGQAVEAIVLVMVVYLAISLTIALATNLYNSRVMQRGTERNP